MVELEIFEDLSRQNIAAGRVTAAGGVILEFMSEVELTDRVITLRQFAIWGVGVGPGELGWVALRRLAREMMEIFDVDRIRIEEPLRRSGANPGRTARTIEFKR
ncbi:unnamed protein product [Phaeothamnion confervicola]